MMTFTNGPGPSSPASGTTRWNQDNSTVEVWDGIGWQTITSGGVKNLTLEEMVQGVEDEIAVMIEEEYKDNAAIQDAFDQWEEANKRFRVILSLAGKK